MNEDEKYISDLVRDMGLLEVTSADVFDYSWSTTEVYYSPTARRFFWYSDSGCSCNSFGDSPIRAGDLEDGDRAAAIEAVRGYDNTDEAMRAIRDYKVPA